MSKNSEPPKNGLVALEAAAAEITTASVTIRTLRVSGRQLTMGTFRQLPTAELIDPVTVQLRGTVWGWVNYLCDNGPDTVELHGEQRQFVVQFGAELRRCSLRHRLIHDCDDANYPQPAKDILDRLRRTFHASLIRRALDGQLELPEERNEKGEARCEIEGGPGSPFCELVLSRWECRELELLTQTAATVRTPQYFTEEQRLTETKRWQDHQDRTRAELVERLAKTEFEGLDLSQIEAQMRAHIQSFHNYQGRWNAMMKQLWDVPQLFIAT